MIATVSGMRSASWSRCSRSGSWWSARSSSWSRCRTWPATWRRRPRPVPTHGPSPSPRSAMALSPVGIEMPADANCNSCHLTGTGLVGTKPIPVMGHPLAGWRDCTACHTVGSLVQTAPGHTSLHKDDCLICHQTRVEAGASEQPELRPEHMGTEQDLLRHAMGSTTTHPSRSRCAAAATTAGSATTAPSSRTCSRTSRRRRARRPGRAERPRRAGRPGASEAPASPETDDVGYVLRGARSAEAGAAWPCSGPRRRPVGPGGRPACGCRHRYHEPCCFRH